MSECEECRKAGLEKQIGIGMRGAKVSELFRNINPFERPRGGGDCRGKKSDDYSDGHCCVIGEMMVTFSVPDTMVVEEMKRRLGGAA